MYDGLKWFFSELLGGALREIGSELKTKIERRTGTRQLFEYSDFKDMLGAFSKNEIEGTADVKIKKACLSNFAPLYLCFPGNISKLNERVQDEAEKARALYDSLKKRNRINDDSLFIKAVQGEARIDKRFREYVEGKKFKFLGLSLARFGPLTENICYSAVFESGKELKQYTAPLKKDANLEPYVPLFYDTTSPRVVERLPYIDVEIYGKVMRLPFQWEDLLRKRGIQIADRPYCMYVPSNKPYHIDIVGLQTFMSFDSWIVFSVPKLKLELPWYCRFDPNNEQSRQIVSETFTEIYNDLNSKQHTDVLFYSDYLQPFVSNVLPTFNGESIKKLLSRHT